MAPSRSRHTKRQAKHYTRLAWRMRKSACRRIVVKTISNLSAAQLFDVVSPIGLGKEPGYVADLRPLFDPQKIEELRQRASDQGRWRDFPDIERYFALTCERTRGRKRFVGRLLKHAKEVDLAYVDRCPVTPKLLFGGGSGVCNQQHLESADRGIDALYAQKNGGDGSGVRFVDLELGWNLDHPDLVDAKVTCISGINAHSVHGTKVLGIVLATDNDLGGVGIVPGLAESARVVSFLRTGSVCNVGEAVVSALTWLREGDVLLLEVAFAPGGLKGQQPIEVVPAIFDAIKCATALGVVVVEPAGNGRVNLDSIYCLNRSHVRFQDSGAIVVAAAVKRGGYRATYATSWGNRIDCFAHGKDVQTSRHDLRGRTLAIADSMSESLWAGLTNFPKLGGECAPFDGTSAIALGTSAP